MYKIKELIIYKSKRFGVTGIHKLVFTPKSIFQLILGGNGSGKTSLLEELSPLPSDLSKTYNKGGGKKITILTEEGLFILTSGMDLGRKHSFILEQDGIKTELNEGGLATMQISLVYKFFKVTPLIHNMAIGKKKFTGMTATERKNWLTTLDSVDYAEIFDIYEKHKTTLRDLKGALKLSVSSNIDASKVLSEQARAQKINERSVLESKMTRMRERIDSYTNREVPEDLTEQLKESFRQLQELSKIDLMTVPKDEVDELLLLRNNELYNIKEEIKDINTELKYTRLSNEFESRNTVDLEERLDALSHAQKVLDDINKYSIDPKLIYRQVGRLSSVIGPLKVKIKHLDSFNREIGTRKLTDIEQRRQDLDSLVSMEKDELIKLKALRDHYNDHDTDDKVNCPKCNHEFNPTTYSMDIDSISKNIGLSEDSLDRYKSMQEQLKQQMSIFTNRSILHKEIQELLEQDVLRPFTFHIYEHNEFNIIDDFDCIIPSIEKELIHMEKFRDYQNIEDELNVVRTELDYVMQEKETLSKINREYRAIKVVEDELSALTHKRIAVEGEIRDLKTHKNNLSHIFDVCKDSMDIKSKRLEEVSYSITNDEIKTLNSIIDGIQTSIDRINEDLSIDDNLIHEIDFESKKIESLQEMYDNELEIVEGLSPNKGMIGEAIGGFMSEFLGHVNLVIDEMWEYKLEIEPCKLNKSGSLDYNFPVKIKGITTLKDVREGSLGMLEIMDLAFTVTSLKYLGLNEYPLFLDEFGTAMDAKHRPNAFDLLRKISAGHSAIFMISHFMEFYGGFANLDVNVINTDHVNMDTILTYNQNLKISR